MWNIGTLAFNSIELVKALKKCKINVTCTQETKWVGAKAKEIDGYMFWYFSFHRDKNEVHILVEKGLVEQVVEVTHKSIVLYLSS